MDSQFHSSEVAALFAPAQQLAYMLEFEGALAKVQGELGLIPETAARTIAGLCADRKLIARIDLSAAAIAGNPAIPFVQQLRTLVKAVDPEAAEWVHHGSTSQDVIDTATMLAMRDTLRLVRRDLHPLCETVATLAQTHAQTPMIARTLLQQAMPTTLGYKFAAALAGLDQIAARLAQLMRSGLFLQLSGPVGTLTSAGVLAPELVAGVAVRLRLRPAPICWHTNRVCIAEFGTALATLTGQLGKMARDLILQMQSEIGELSESSAPGKGGSTAMPHKHNPVDSVAAVAAATTTPHLASTLLTTMLQEHERAAGAWHAEWIVLPQLCSLTHGALLSLTNAFRGLRIDSQRMQANLSSALREIAEKELPAATRDLAAAEARTHAYLTQRKTGADSDG
ncbi:MAG TPA: lyase family protein [Povalibacter sp.]|uniref:lyase family protein n=1 Tax=Povalibacter sp. TaxID=1962978 RepID=UPI002B647A1D|nr:lyase family protein [Povalibacter sp.]HMN44343.1 lyase family protein [Povalibacter sp.]